MVEEKVKGFFIAESLSQPPAEIQYQQAFQAIVINC